VDALQAAPRKYPPNDPSQNLQMMICLFNQHGLKQTKQQRLIPWNLQPLLGPLGGITVLALGGTKKAASATAANRHATTATTPKRQRGRPPMSNSSEESIRQTIQIQIQIY
jgi:hypothetical protein